MIYPLEYGGTRPADFDMFYELVLWDELGRAGGGNVLQQMSINSMALPPIMNNGSKFLKVRLTSVCELCRTPASCRCKYYLLWLQSSS